MKPVKFPPANFAKFTLTLFVAACVAVFLVPEGRAQKGTGAKKGTWEKIKVHGKSLEGNLEGDSPDRDTWHGALRRRS